MHNIKEQLELRNSNYQNETIPSATQLIACEIKESDLWETPPEIFDPLNEEFNFDWDVCATETTSKVAKRFFSPEQNALNQDWHLFGKTFWMNPPYSKEGRKDDFIRKAQIESRKGCTIVALLPSNTDTKVFHEVIYNNSNVEIRFLKGRIRFLWNGKRKDVGKFPSMVVIFRPTNLAPGESNV